MDTQPSSPSPKHISKRFNLPLSDITVQSLDGVLFKLHRINLEMHSQVFASAGGSTVGAIADEIVSLSEPAAVLELMFQYVYLQRQPNLQTVDFEIMKELAEAVEKYEIYCAMGVCSQRMREWTWEHPSEVLLYAVRHKYIDLANESAEATLDISPYAMLNKLPPDIFAAWIEYMENYRQMLNKEFTRFGPTRLHRGITVPCDIWHEHYALISSELSSGISTRFDCSSKARYQSRPFSRDYKIATTTSCILTCLPQFLEKRQALTGDRCGDCKRELGYWLHQTERDWREAKRFTEYL